METRSQKGRDSDAESVASVSSEPAITRSRSTTPFTLRSQCTRHGSACPEGHGINFRSRLSPSPTNRNKKSPKKMFIERNGNVRRNLMYNTYEKNHKSKTKSSTSHVSVTKSTNLTSDYSSAEEEANTKNSGLSTPISTVLKTSKLER